jgi:hypothetical protein
MDLDLTQNSHHNLAGKPTHVQNSSLIYETYYKALQSYSRKLEDF